MANSKEALEVIEARRKIAKLDLETRALQVSLSFRGRALEWLKAATVPVAIVGVAVTFGLGLQQLQRSALQQTSEQFDKVLTRMLGGKAPERVAAVGGLSLFLTEDRKDFHTAALTYLVGAAAVEDDASVQTTFVHALSAVKNKLQPDALNAALRLAIVHSRRMSEHLIADTGKWDDERNEFLNNSLKQRRRVRSEYDIGTLVNSLARTEYFEFLDRFHPRTHKSRRIFADGRDPAATLHVPNDPVELGRLATLASLIERLVLLGAYSPDYSGMYCEKCDFSRAPPGHFVGARFVGASLRGANFSFQNLKRAQFIDTDLRGAIFFRADLSDATISLTKGRNDDVNPRQVRALSAISLDDLPFPALQCATLTGATLRGVAVGHIRIVLESTDIEFIDFHRPRSWEWPTTLTDAQIVVEVWISDAWLNTRPPDWAVGGVANYLRELGLTDLSGPDDIARLNVVKGFSFLRYRRGFASRDSGELSTSLTVIGFLPYEGTNAHARTETRDSLVPVIAEYFKHDMAFGGIPPRPINCGAEKAPGVDVLWERALFTLR